MKLTVAAALALRATLNKKLQVFSELSNVVHDHVGLSPQHKQRAIEQADEMMICVENYQRVSEAIRRCNEVTELEVDLAE